MIYIYDESSTDHTGYGPLCPIAGPGFALLAHENRVRHLASNCAVRRLIALAVSSAATSPWCEKVKTSQRREVLNVREIEP